MNIKYVDTKYKPTSKDLIAEFYMEPNRIPFEKAAAAVALESSIGTWTNLSTMEDRIAKTLKPSVYSLNRKKNIIKIAYPQELFEEGNMPQILSSIAGNIFGMKTVKNLKLLDIQFPKSILKSFKGPLYGIEGVRKLAKVKERPLCGTICKPKLGLTEREHAKVAYDAWMGGLDVVKDDENLTSMSFNNFEKRLKLTVKNKEKAEKQTGERKFYLCNVTAESDLMKKRIKMIKDIGNEHFMIDILTAGFAGLQTVRNHSQKRAIHAHRAMHGAVTRNPKHGISMLTLAKITRLIGADQLHIGTAAVGKMHGSRQEELSIEREIEDQHTKEHGRILEQNWGDIKPTFAVASGGLHAGMTEKLMKIMGNNIIIQAGGGVHGHPGGTIAGARSLRQAVEGVMEGKTLREHAKTNTELFMALKKWGTS
jgi:ribulose-bisphosphate carboxylase large chain